MDHPINLRLANIYISSSHNRTVITAATKCVCFYCKKTTEPKDILEYCDNGNTAICPHCGVDSILPNSAFPNNIIDDNIVTQMQELYFTNGVV